MNLVELTQQREEASKLTSDCENRYNKRLWALTDLARKQALDEFGAELAEVRLRRAVAQKAWQAEADRLALANVQLPYPEGTVMVKWEYWRYDHREKTRPTKERGVIQIFREGDRFRGKWNKPSVGDVIVRDLLNNGKPGLSFVRWEATNGRWVPEGVQHPDAYIDA